MGDEQANNALDSNNNFSYCLLLKLCLQWVPMSF